MTFIVGAIVGGAAISGIANVVSGNRASRTAERGANAAVDATLASTQLQIDEISRQFDIQQGYLAPLIQQQYNAGAAVQALLGIPGGAQLGSNPPPPQFSGPSIAPGGRSSYGSPGGGPGYGGGDSFGPADYRRGGDFQRIPGGTGGRGSAPYNALQPGNRQQFAGPQQQPPLTGPQYPTGDNVAQFTRGDQGQFIDPNLDPRSLEGEQRLEGQVRDTLLAPTDFAGDEYRAYIDDNQISAPTSEMDERVARARDVRIADGAAGTGVYGDEFEDSRGYGFAVEEMGRELDRRDSAGGNYGGRQIMEALRRRDGIADQEYYRWAAGRERDLGRLGAAEAADIYRGDTALSQYEGQRTQDIGRRDAAFGNYLQRRAGDVSRLDSAVSGSDRAREFDLNRSDRGYYNYLGQLSNMASFGNATGAAVNSSASAGGQIAGAHSQQGNALGNIYGNLAGNQASIQYAQGAGVSNAITGGINNWLTYQNLGT